MIKISDLPEACEDDIQYFILPIGKTPTGGIEKKVSIESIVDYVTKESIKRVRNYIEEKEDRVSTNYVQHSFKEGILRLSWYNVAQERKLTPDEARELGESLIEWAGEQQTTGENGWFCGYTQKPEIGCDDEIEVTWRGLTGEDLVTSASISAFAWKQDGTRQQPKFGDIIRWRYVD